ncbi:MAG: hypothetical protein AUJ92_12585 [Armatimonadetes bacterium CG2_30_59_28]|nr:MAG: hypothetical protein AUJ92_12585 [Armatimonadetes bacterium CG2_30_59_28]PIU66299.1 MAG: peptide ABC transporter ATP-binding protein [Armatimonadetes bacterium CG07_land_8_20_14_0_80_59_28]PIX40957.1 MAG: peptide ABC transporter ATP-binding protein [Armatimonadetes bacterium CG_4_8_14_3_um_filter_58_9]PIY44865.1 MAG: peptide ABC transporter ATP-binding protein [Armatimonadetes bacterium CG_4_10_14_3_um_filter_59_10]PJB71535.1 MAG: peptide ABC transporter ATP-binding protein [Armatimonad
MDIHAELNQVTRTYIKHGVPLHALHGVDLSIGRGDWVLVVGDSGSGKSTLLNLLGGLDRPTEGEVRFDGINLTSLTSDDLARFRYEKVGFVFQSFSLISSLTALENVTIPLVPYKMDRVAMEEKAGAVLEQMGMIDRATHLPGELSGGEQQRVAIARSLINEPKLLLADEPTGELDSRTGEKILDLIASLHRDRGVTTIMTSHDPKIAERAHTVVQLEEGRVVDVQQ